ncbi:ACP S-malonyltransferase [Actinomyces vulturis]|uniref:ACP S-malonyltransferase n=1 Tax=Actinomyces vulturis TaxID=1857645 RepID=UPI00082CBBA5|nr:ACP S-malonyltransferase [Actinomyces vulturis]
MARAILCPGQGTQKPGMLKPWLTDETTEFLIRTSEAIGLDLIDLGVNAPADTLRDTAITQPIVAATSIASAMVTGLMPSIGEEIETIVAGHSLGSLTALALCGALEPTDVVVLARHRGLAMAQCAKEAPGSMTVLIGPANVSEELLKEYGISAGNINSSKQIVASGSVDAIATLVENLPNGVRALPLPVAGAFHSPAMMGGQDAVRAACNALTSHISPVTRTLISDLTGQACQPAEALAALPDSLIQPVRWREVMNELAARGVKKAYELAPAGALAGLMKTDHREVLCEKVSPQR